MIEERNPLSIDISCNYILLSKVFVLFYSVNTVCLSLFYAHSTPDQPLIVRLIQMWKKENVKHNKNLIENGLKNLIEVDKKPS